MASTAAQTMTGPEVSASVAKLMCQCSDKVRREWGTGWSLLGPRVQSALLAEALVILATQQDESINPATIVKIINQGWSWIIEETNR